MAYPSAEREEKEEEREKQIKDGTELREIS